MKKLKVGMMLLCLFLASCTSEKAHVFCDAIKCKLSLNLPTGNYVLSGTLINDSNRDASNIIMYAYFKNIYNQEYSVPGVYALKHLSKQTSSNFSLETSYKNISSWRFEISWNDA